MFLEGFAGLVVGAEGEGAVFALAGEGEGAEGDGSWVGGRGVEGGGGEGEDGVMLFGIQVHIGHEDGGGGLVE